MENDRNLYAYHKSCFDSEYIVTVSGKIIHVVGLIPFTNTIIPNTIYRTSLTYLTWNASLAV